MCGINSQHLQYSVSCQKHLSDVEMNINNGIL